MTTIVSARINTIIECQIALSNEHGIDGLSFSSVRFPSQLSLIGGLHKNDDDATQIGDTSMHSRPPVSVAPGATP